MKTVLITGGTRGIGKAISILFAKNSYRVIALYRSNEEKANVLLPQLTGTQHRIIKCDVTNAIEVESTFKKLPELYDQIDVVVNNAGIGYHHEIDKVDFQEWQDTWTNILATNLIGPSNICYQAAQLLMKQKHGHIINVGSRGGYRGEPLMPAYGASKAGLHSMSQSLAQSLAPYKIFVGAVAPGFVETDMSRPRLKGEVGENIKSQSPMNRVAQPEEVAQAVFQMSQANIWMTGSVWDVNGASYMR